MIRYEELPAKVEAVNACHQAANELYDKLAPIFQNLLGHKVAKYGGNLTAKIEKRLPKLHYPGISIVWNPGVNSIAWTVKASVNKGYHTVTVYVAFTDHDGTLIRIADKEIRRTDWTLEEVKRRLIEAENLKRQYEDAKNALMPFER